MYSKIFKLIFCFLIFSNFSFAQNQNITSFYEGPFEDVVKEASRTKKPIFIDFSATWCKPCQKMEQETFADPLIAEKLNTDFIAYKVDVDDFNGLAVAQKYNVSEYPTYLILDSKTNKIGTIKGFYYANQFMKEIDSAMNPEVKNAVKRKKKIKIFGKK